MLATIFRVLRLPVSVQPQGRGEQVSTVHARLPSDGRVREQVPRALQGLGQPGQCHGDERERRVTFSAFISDFTSAHHPPALPST